MRYTFSSNLGRILKEYNITQTELARQCDLCPSTLYRYCFDKIECSSNSRAQYNVIQRISRALKMPIQLIFPGTLCPNGTEYIYEPDELDKIALKMTGARAAEDKPCPRLIQWRNQYYLPPGTTVTIGEMYSAHGDHKIRRAIGTVVGVYDYHMTIRMKGGWIESFIWHDVAKRIRRADNYDTGGI